MKPNSGVLKPVLLKSNFYLLISLFLLIFLFGCAGMELDHVRGAWYPTELGDADRAVEAARTAGKDKQFPAEFKEIEKMKNDAYDTYWSCHEKEGIEMANEAASRARALLAKNPEPPKPPAPTVSLSASPASIERGQCTTLRWSSSNASRASIDPGVGGVDPNGSRQVCPGSTTQYTIAAAGDGGSRTASTTVTVTAPPPPAAIVTAPPPPPPAAIVTAPPPPPPPAVRAPAAPRVVERLTLHVNFDFDKSNIRGVDNAELQKAIDAIKKYPGSQISVEGHTDYIGTEKYNQALSERRAAAVKAYLVKHGVAASEKIETKGYGESKPIADNKTKQGRFENRRVEILIVSQ